MICAECDKLDRMFIRPRTERAQRRVRGKLTPEIEARLDSEEEAARTAIQEHKASDHQPGDVYQ